MSRPALFGGIEAGGTKYVCAVGTGPGDCEEVRFPTRDPDSTLREAADFFRAKAGERGPIEALGIGTFGPAAIDPRSPEYGRIKATPKPGWEGADVVGGMRGALGAADLPVAFDTDVNAAAWGERRWGVARGLDDFVYLTVGTGIGGGVVAGGRLVGGTGHPEVGHRRIARVEGDPFAGCCPFHGDCLEGLASGESLRRRWRCDPRTLPAEHEAWGIEARYIADALINLVCTLVPEKLILGGGVMDQPQLLPLVRKRFHERNAHYLDLRPAEELIVAPELGARAGVLGAIALASDLSRRARS